MAASSDQTESEDGGVAPVLGESRYALLGDAREPPPEDSEYYQNITIQKDGDKRVVQIAAKTLVLDKADAHQYLTRINDSGAGDIKRLDIFADRLTIRTRLVLPGAEVHLHARELRFEDEGQEIGAIDVTPKSIATRPSPRLDGAHGVSAGDIYVYAETFVSQNHRADRLVAVGGRGQPAGYGVAGTAGSSATLLTTSHPDLIRCAEQNGLAKRTEGIPADSVVPAEITLAQLKASGIHTSTAAPTSGTNASPGGRPGNASDGGDVFTNVENLAPYTRLSAGGAGQTAGFSAGGSAGTPRTVLKPGRIECRSFNLCTGAGPRNCDVTRRLFVDEITRVDTTPGVGANGPAAARTAGTPGQVRVEAKPYGWLHPHAIEMVVTYADDAFLNGFRDLAKQILEEEQARIATYAAHSSYSSVADADKQALGKLSLRIASLLNRLNAHEDYFGNPLKWVPALSLEANKALFDQELEWAVRTIYVTDWINHDNNAAKSKVQALSSAREVLREQIAAAERRYTQAMDKLPGLKGEAANLEVKIADLQEDLERVQAVLLARAEDNVEDRHKVPWWRKGLKVLAGVAKIFPVGQPILGGIGSSLDLINKFDPDAPFDSILAVPDAIGSFAKSDAPKKADDAKKKAEDTKKEAEKAEETKQSESLKAQLKELREFTKPIIEELKKHKDLLKGAEAPETEVTAELEKLKGEDPEFQRLAAKVQSLLADKALFAANLTETIETLEQSLVVIGEGYMQIASLIPAIDQTADIILDQRAELTLLAMRDQAQKRLMKYQYWLAKAYEYRTLRSYQGDLTLTRLFERVATLVTASQDGRISSTDFQTLSTLFRNDLANIIHEITADYNDHAAEQTVAVVYNLTEDELAKLNAGEHLPVNFWEKGLFRPDHEDVRIVKLEVSDLDTTQTGRHRSFAYMDIDMEHDGLSRIWRNRRVHVFQHYNKSTQQPMRWSSRLQDGAIEHHQLSASSESLIRALVGTGGSDIMLFSRPSAWADVRLKKTVLSDGDTDFVIRNMKLRLTYDYVPASGSASWAGYKNQQNAQIQDTYASLLERGASPSELGVARSLLDVGYSAPALNDALVVTHHQEYLERRADDLYEAELHRAASDAERAWASAELDAERSEAQLADYIGLITGAIADTYGRAPTYDELVQYTQLLDDGWL